jgi:hypothetical protein
MASFCSGIKAVPEDHFCDQVIGHARETHSESQIPTAARYLRSETVAEFKIRREADALTRAR